eukprot:s2423_g18.t1
MPNWTHGCVCRPLSKICFSHSWHSRLRSNWIAKGATASFQSLRPTCLCVQCLDQFLNEPLTDRQSLYEAWDSVAFFGNLLICVASLAETKLNGSHP